MMGVDPLAWAAVVVVVVCIAMESPNNGGCTINTRLSKDYDLNYNED